MAKVAAEPLETRAARMRDLLAKDPSDAMLWFGLGCALLELSDPCEAVSAFEQATEIDPDYTAAFRDLGRAHLENGNGCEAARVFAHAIALAEKTGDLQTGREIHVFLRRAEASFVELKH